MTESKTSEPTPTDIYRLLIKGGRSVAQQAAAKRGCEVLHCIELPERSNTVVLARCDVLEIHRWYSGDAHERRLIRRNKPLPPGSLLYFGQGAGDSHQASPPGD